jgi:proteasome beta subunit
MDSSAAIRVAVEALYDAADDDSATGGPDLSRRIWPTLTLVDAEGLRFLDDDTLAAVVEQIVADRRGNPGGAR